MPYITEIYAKEVIDGAGYPTLEVSVETESGFTSCIVVPSELLANADEACILRDKDPKRYNGLGVTKAVNIINNQIRAEILGFDCRNQRAIDNALIKLDGTENKSKLGANAILGVSLACCAAASEYSDLPLYKYIGGFNACTLPTPLINVLNGGKNNESGFAFQEILISAISAKSFSEALRMSNEVYNKLQEVLKEKNYSTLVCAEGGYAPNIKTNEEAIQLVERAIKQAGYKVKQDFMLAIDASSEYFYDKETKKYNLKNEKKSLNYKELVSYYESICSKHAIISIEDGVFSEDVEAWSYLTARLGSHIQVASNDLFKTNTERMDMAFDNGLANAVIIKMDQIGTLSETIDAIEFAKINGYTAIISCAGLETTNSIISDIAVGLNTGLVKFGSLSRSEKVTKYNRLLEIEEELTETSLYKGLKAFYSIQ